MATITKPLVTTTVTVLHQNDHVAFADAVGADGKVTRDGTNARYQILHGDTVAGNADSPDGIVYMEIPFHAVVMATVTTETSQPITVPEDTFCVSENDTSDEGGSNEGGSNEGGSNKGQQL